MKIKKVKIKGFKRFTDLTVEGIPETAKLILLVGPNGSGKTSLFEAFNLWYKLRAFSRAGDEQYFLKKDAPYFNNNWNGLVDVEFFDTPPTVNKDLQGKFYFRTAYRNEPDFTINQLTQQNDPRQNIKLETLMQNDRTVSENYQRLVSQTLTGVFNASNDTKTVLTLREEIIGKIKESMSRIFNDLNLSSIGNPLSNGSFFFEKGSSKDFHYKNLSAGEKSVFDLILDLIIKSTYFENATFCIDEPEAHMHTRLQSKVLKELYTLIPDGSQLWISTHSIGMLKEAEDLENANPNTVFFLDFDNRDFDVSETITPSPINKTIWQKFFDLTFADFASLIAPSKIVFCEGTSLGRKYKDFDAQIYGKIFSNEFYDTIFISIGSSSELENIENTSLKIIANILKSSEILKFIDRDGRSPEEVEELRLKGVKTSQKRHIESYLLDDEIIKKLSIKTGKEELFPSCQSAKRIAIENSVRRGNPSDDVKSASGEIVVEMKRILSLTESGNNTSAFLRDTLAPLVTMETQVYQNLKAEIFG
ncbi:MAG: AAA family ATPase [Bacteroidetes bacterium]|nr:AAA family ATPase [Bacteroidota bacterium]